ncbi:MAG: alkylhydroperoxidase-related (seleno)protein, partial [Myxococcota bacterium]
FGAELIAYADAVVARSTDVPETRDAVHKSMGDAGVVDAAAVIANFQRMVRIADGTGIPIDGPLDVLSADIRHEIGINEFPSAEGRGRNGTLRRLAAPLMRLAMARFMRLRLR